jgi:predicted NBD/HSP70 family sugar kinase
MKKATRQFTKNHNITLVLKTIFQQTAVSRAEVARITRLTRTTVSDIVGALIEEGLVHEVGVGESLGGKRPMLVGIEKDARVILCMDLSRRGFRGALVNLRGEILERTNGGREHYRGEAALQQVFAQLDNLVEKTSQPILGIGIGTPGLIDTREGVVRRAVNLDWNDLPLKKILSERYHLPVHVANDSHVAALAEYSYGELRDVPNLVVVKAGEGIGSGIVLGGKIFYGDGFAAGEIGHLVVGDNGLLCTCGNYGCLETEAGTRAILQRAANLVEQHPGVLPQANPNAKLSLEDVHQAFLAGVPQVTELVSAAARALGVAIANLIGVLDMQQVILSGEITELGEPFLDLVRQQARRRVLSDMVENTTLRLSSLGADHVLLGASALVLSQELELP